MKKNCWLLFGVMLSANLMGQQVTNLPPAPPVEAPVQSTTNAPETPGAGNAAAATNSVASKPAKKSKKTAAAKPRPKSPAAELRTVPLVPGPAVVEANRVNVRGQPRFKGEVLARLTKGQQVTVLEEITRNNSAADEPSAWAKILLPPGAHVWVNSSFLDANKAVKPKKLNLRGGPGENYSIVGQLRAGETVTEIGTKGNWTEIEPPAGAYAFVAAQYLKQEPASAVAATTPAEPATVPEQPAIAAAPTEPPTNATPETATPPETPAITNATPETAAAPAAEEPPPKRIVEREGVVRGSGSIQAPTSFSLVSPDNGRMIDYLYTTSPYLDLRRYKGLHIIVTGEEGLDERWGNTPVLTIQKIQVLD